MPFAGRLRARGSALAVLAPDGERITYRDLADRVDDAGDRLDRGWWRRGRARCLDGGLGDLRGTVVGLAPDEGERGDEEGGREEGVTAQRDADRLYWLTDRGTNTATMIAAQMMV